MFVNQLVIVLCEDVDEEKSRSPFNEKESDRSVL